MTVAPPSRAQAWALVALRTLVGWHFVYEGYYKLALPAWSPAGAPLGHWTASGYLKAATGPVAALVRPLASPGALAWIDVLVPVALVLVGLSLLLGLFTQLGCWGALGLLSMFYVTAIPTDGVQHPWAEGAYLLVNKNLVELGAVVVLLLFRTGRLAGLDVLRRGRMRG